MKVAGLQAYFWLHTFLVIDVQRFYKNIDFYEVNCCC